jgi:hypothetical protein
LISLTERLVIPLIGAGALLIRGRPEGHGAGFQTYVRYAAFFLFGALTIFAWGDWILRLIPWANIVVLAILWGFSLASLAWYRHLR